MCSIKVFVQLGVSGSFAHAQIARHVVLITAYRRLNFRVTGEVPVTRPRWLTRSQIPSPTEN